MKARAAATSVVVAGAASMMLAVAVPAEAEPSFVPASTSSFMTAPADCANSGQTGSDANPSPAPGPQSGIDAMPSPSPGECVNIGPGGPGYNGTDPRGKS